MKNNIVQKSNTLINASYSMTTTEQQLLIASISKFNSHNFFEACREPVEITVSDMQEIFYSESDKQNAYRDLEVAANRIFDRELSFGDPETGKYSRYRWLKKVDFDSEEKTLTLFFNETLAPFFFDLKANYTSYRLRHAAQLTSIYAIRIYELIVSWHGQNRTFWELNITELRTILNIVNKYKKFSEFKKGVIETAVNQINEFTDFKLEITFKKVGRRFKKVQFRFDRKRTAILEEIEYKKKKAFKQEQKAKRERKDAIKEQQIIAKSTEFPPDGTFVRINGVMSMIEGRSASIEDKDGKRFIIPEIMILKAIENGKLEIVSPDDEDLKSYFDDGGNNDLFGF